MRSILIVLLALSLSSCVMYDHWDMCETMRKGDEIRFQYPAPDSPIAREIKVKRVPLPTKCREFYNDGTGRWAECMGVEPK